MAQVHPIVPRLGQVKMTRPLRVHGVLLSMSPPLFPNACCRPEPSSARDSTGHTNKPAGPSILIRHSSQAKMVSLEQMRASNARIPHSLPQGLVAVFVGGTSGIGETTMKKFAKHTVRPRIYFIGRSEQSAIRILAELQALNPAGEYHFLQGDVSLLQNVDDVCRELHTKETRINLLFLTCGTMVTSQGGPPFPRISSPPPRRQK